MDTKDKLPRSIFYIILNEATERFTFYGMKAILTTYLVSQFFNPLNDPARSTFANAKANDLTHFFNTLVYFLPLAGAIIADWFWGKFKTILYLSFVYCAGCFTLAFFTDDFLFFQLGLLLIAVGSGGIKPCVSANVGDQFTGNNEHLASKAYGWFYFSINVGAFLSQLLTPVLLITWGPRVAFGIPGFLMALSTLIFLAGKKQYIIVPPSGIKKDNFISISWFLVKEKYKNRGRSAVAARYNPQQVNSVLAVWKILLFFSTIPVFWALNDQSTSEWVLQATALDLNFWGRTWLPQQVQSANAILVLLYIPLFNYIIFPAFKRKGIELDPLKKVGIGFFLTLLSFGLIYWLQLQIDKGLHPKATWQIAAYIILTAAEVLIYQTGLEFAYSEAPKNMKSTIMAIWLLTISLGNFIVSAINKSIAGNGLFSFMKGSNYYLFYICLMSVTIIIYNIIVAGIRKRKRRELSIPVIRLEDQKIKY